MPHHRAIVVCSGERGNLELLHLLDQHRGHCVNLAAGRQQHDLRDCQRQRQVNREVRAFAGFGHDRDPTAERGGLRAHHVHPNAAPCQFGHFFGSRKAGVENQVSHFSVGQFAVIGQQAGRPRLVANAAQVQALAVIRELDHDFIAFLADFNQQFADFIFPR